MSRRFAFRSPLSTAAAILILAAGCADQSPTSVRPDPGAELSAAQLVGRKATPVLAAQPYQAGTYRQVIGPEGGTLRFGIGEITFPAGAVAQPTLITAGVDGETMAVSFGPHGISFPEGAQPMLTLSSAAAASDGVIIYSGDTSEILEVVATKHHGGVFSGLLKHFSRYILIIP